MATTDGKYWSEVVTVHLGRLVLRVRNDFIFCLSTETLCVALWSWHFHSLIQIFTANHTLCLVSETRKGRSYRVLHNVGLVRQPGWVLHLKHHPVTTSAIRSHATVVGRATILKCLKNGVVSFKRVIKHSNLVCWNRRDVWRHGCLSNHPVGNTIGWWEKSGHSVQRVF